MSVRFEVEGRNRDELLEQVRERYEEYVGHVVYLGSVVPDGAQPPWTRVQVPEMDVVPTRWVNGKATAWRATVELPA